MNNVILCGFQYAGKTTLGKYLAEKLNRNFIDTDNLIAEIYFKENNLQTARNLYHTMGAENFRELERDVIRGLKNENNSIIATGGGSLLHPDNRSLLRKIGTLIYLDWPMEVLKARIVARGPGAFLDVNNLDESFQNLYTKRHEIFLQTMHHTVKMMDDTIEESAQKILHIIQGKKHGE